MKRLVLVSLMLASVTILFSSCNQLNRMKKNVDQVEVTCKPEVVTLKGQNVEADVTVTFPAKYFGKKVVGRITPVIVYDGGETTGISKFLQGERVKDNFQVISWRNGDSYTQRISIPYDPNMDLSTLMLRFEGRNRNATTFIKIADLVAAQGVSTVQKLADIPYTVIMQDNFKRITTITEDADIHYIVNRYDVRPAELTTEQIKLFQDFIKENDDKDNVTLGTLYSKGYASPEGPEDFNDKLSKNRSESGQTAIQKTLKGVDINYDAAAYGEDWDGFKKLVQQSNIADKDLILQVLSMYESSARRDQEIRNLSQVFEVLKKDILPQLRRTQLVASADIVGKSDEELVAAIRRGDTSLNVEEMLFAATLLTDRNEIANAYKLAASQHNDVRAFNNLGVTLLHMGDVNGAKVAVDRAAKIQTSPAVTNNLAAIAIAQGDLDTAKQYLSGLNTPEARKNKALVALMEGDYTAAARDLDGFNLAVLEVLNGNYAKAKTTLGTCDCPRSNYLRAIIAMREGSSSNALSYLRSAIGKDSSYRARAQRDIEFAKLHGTPEFNAL